MIIFFQNFGQMFGTLVYDGGGGGGGYWQYPGNGGKSTASSA